MSVSNGGGSPLRSEAKRGGSIMLNVYQTDGNDIWTLVSVDSYAVGGHSTPNISRRQHLAFSSQAFILNRKGSFPVSLGSSSQQPATLGFLWYSSQ